MQVIWYINFNAVITGPIPNQ